MESNKPKNKLSISEFEKILNKCEIKYVQDCSYEDLPRGLKPLKLNKSILEGFYGVVAMHKTDSQETFPVYLNKNKRKTTRVDTMIHEVMHIYFQKVLNLPVLLGDQTIEVARKIYSRENPEVYDVVKKYLGISEE